MQREQPPGMVDKTRVGSAIATFCNRHPPQDANLCAGLNLGLNLSLNLGLLEEVEFDLRGG
jgi:hypothetical protein